MPVAALHEIVDVSARATASRSNTSMTTDACHGRRRRALARRWLVALIAARPVARLPIRRALQYAAEPAGAEGLRSAEPDGPPRPTGERACRVAPASCRGRSAAARSTTPAASTARRSTASSRCGTVDDVRQGAGVRAAQRAQGLDRPASVTAWAGRRSRRARCVLDMRAFNRMTLDEPAADGPRRERRDVARHPEPDSPALCGQGDAVDRHLLGRRIDFGQRARDGSPVGLGRPHDPRDAGDARRRHGSAASAGPTMRGSSSTSSAATACSA